MSYESATETKVEQVGESAAKEGIRDRVRSLLHRVQLVIGAATDGVAGLKDWPRSTKTGGL